MINCKGNEEVIYSLIIDPIIIYSNNSVIFNLRLSHILIIYISSKEAVGNEFISCNQSLTSIPLYKKSKLT